MTTLDTLAASATPIGSDQADDAAGGIFHIVIFYLIGYNVGRGF